MARWKIGRIEADRLDRLRFDDVECSLVALGAELEIRANFRGAEADRLLDETHARLVARVVELLRSSGWETRVEVTYSRWGERGSYDILAWHPVHQALLVVEVKSELPSIEATLRSMDVKARLAEGVVEDRFGWRPRVVARVLVLPEDRTARRAVERHAVVLRSVLPRTSREVRAWLRRPAGVMSGIWFVSPAGGGSWPRNPSSVQRVRSVRIG